MEPMMTFQELVRTCPAIAQLKADAASIAQQERRPWYAAWLEDSTIFAMAIRAAAEKTGAPPAAIRGVVLTGLLDAYYTARRRRAKREAVA